MPEAGVIAAWLGILVTAGGALAGVVKGEPTFVDSAVARYGAVLIPLSSL